MVHIFKHKPGSVKDIGGKTLCSSTLVKKHTCGMNSVYCAARQWNKNCTLNPTNTNMTTKHTCIHASSDVHLHLFCLKCTADCEDYSIRGNLVWGLLYWFNPQLVGACLDKFKQERKFPEFSMDKSKACTNWYQ